MIEKQFIYFYRTENQINDNFYYGVHKTFNLEDGYMGSGVRIQRAVKKYGKENFNKEILLFFDTFDEALDYEATIVTEKLLKNGFLRDFQVQKKKCMTGQKENKYIEYIK